MTSPIGRLQSVSHPSHWCVVMWGCSVRGDDATDTMQLMNSNVRAVRNLLDIIITISHLICCSRAIWSVKCHILLHVTWQATTSPWVNVLTKCAIVFNHVHVHHIAILQKTIMCVAVLHYIVTSWPGLHYMLHMLVALSEIIQGC